MKNIRENHMTQFQAVYTVGLRNDTISINKFKLGDFQTYPGEARNGFFKKKI